MVRKWIAAEPGHGCGGGRHEESSQVPLATWVSTGGEWRCDECMAALGVDALNREAKVDAKICTVSVVNGERVVHHAADCPMNRD